MRIIPASRGTAIAPPSRYQPGTAAPSRRFGKPIFSPYTAAIDIFRYYQHIGCTDLPIYIVAFSSTDTVERNLFLCRSTSIDFFSLCVARVLAITRVWTSTAATSFVSSRVHGERKWCGGGACSGKSPYTTRDRLGCPGDWHGSNNCVGCKFSTLTCPRVCIIYVPSTQRSTI